MCKYTMGGFETSWPAVGYNELDNYHPIARTYLIGWKTDNPLENYALNCLLMAGFDRGFYQRKPLSVGPGDFSLFLVDVAEFCWLQHLQDIIRILCGNRWCCYSPFERASNQWKVESDEFDVMHKAKVERYVTHKAATERALTDSKINAV